MDLEVHQTKAEKSSTYDVPPILKVVVLPAATVTTPNCVLDELLKLTVPIAWRANQNTHDSDQTTHFHFVPRIRYAPEKVMSAVYESWLMALMTAPSFTTIESLGKGTTPPDQFAPARQHISRRSSAYKQTQPASRMHKEIAMYRIPNLPDQHRSK